MPTGSMFGLLNNMHATYQSTNKVYKYEMACRTILRQSAHGMANEGRQVLSNIQTA